MRAASSMWAVLRAGDLANQRLRLGEDGREARVMRPLHRVGRERHQRIEAGLESVHVGERLFQRADHQRHLNGAAADAVDADSLLRCVDLAEQGGRVLRVVALAAFGAHRIGGREGRNGAVAAQLIAPAVGADIIAGDDEARALLRGRLDARAEERDRERARDEFIGAAVERAADELVVELPCGQHHVREGIGAGLALAQRAHQGAEVVGVLRDVGHEQIEETRADELRDLAMIHRRRDASEAQHLERGAQRVAVGEDRIEQQDVRVLEAKAGLRMQRGRRGHCCRPSLMRLLVTTPEWPRTRLTRLAGTALIGAAGRNDGKEIRGFEARAADQNAVNALRA
jgi:hypothetical protein